MLTQEQIDAATGLFHQMNERKLDVPPEVFAMFGLLLGAVKGAVKDEQPKDQSTEQSNEQPTTTVDLVIRLQVKGAPAEVAGHLGALQCLASVMAMQAEDGLWSAGHPDGDTDNGPSEYVADIERAYEQSVRIDGKIAWTADEGDA